LSDKEKDLQKAINDLKEKSLDIELKLETMKIGASEDKIQAINYEISANQARTHALIQDITKEVQARQEAEEDFTKAYEESFKNYRDAAFNAARQAKEIFQTATKGMEDAILKFVQTGKLSFKSLIQDMLNTILRSQIQQIVARIFTITGLNQAGNAIGSMLGLASGGVIPTNRPVLVGERGPEIIAGASGRVVTPNNQLGGGSVTYNINAVDALSFKQMVAQDPQFIYALTEQGRRSVPGTRR
jgi:lambda family phage tail tape measure protein